MGLACSQVRLLTITSRKADLEYNISIDSKEKMALAREQSNLSQEYYSRLKAQKICYFANNQYNNITYQYLMGNGNINLFMKNLKNKNNINKDDLSTVLTDYRGLVVLNNEIANTIKTVTGVELDAYGRGKPFTCDDEMLKALFKAALPGMPAEDIDTAIEDGVYIDTYSSHKENTRTREQTEESSTKTHTVTNCDLLSTIEFYIPIFKAAAANGFTTEYNNEINTNKNYVSDALVSGTFCLASVGKDHNDNYTGDYEPNTSLTYFITRGTVQERTDSEAREEVTAWYNAEKARISEKENFLDIEIKDLSTELEAINTEIQAVKTLIDDAIQSVFSWGSA